jgi:bifunctional UDP-N-acetylglucosamine pyrophosphorylase/glucosamine-1-phosphate N-acetyltransferase
MYSCKPKVLHTLAGRPLLQHVLDCAKKLEPEQTCVVYGHGGDAVPSAMQNYPAQFVIQDPQLGTGHAVQQAMPFLKNGTLTLVLYGDVPLIQQETLQRMLQTSGEIVLLTVMLPDPTGYGRIVRNTAGHITRIVEEKDATDEQRKIKEVNTGILLISTELLQAGLAGLKNNNSQGEYYLTDIISTAVQQGVPIQTVQPSGEWEILGVNSKAQLADLERIFQKNEAAKLLRLGVTLADPTRIDVRGNLICGQDVEIDVGCIFEGEVKLGDNVKVGAYSIIKNTSIATNSQVAAYSHIEFSTVGTDCCIGPYARLRPGTKLHNNVHIGNFVETKNSELGEGSKANHLSYLGDSTIGQHVNIGAGTITCNYDGANKHRTVIEDEAFIGSDTQLIAPVKIGRGATIGAGSTITRDAPAGDLTLSRSKQTSVTGWKRPVKNNRQA